MINYPIDYMDLTILLQDGKITADQFDDAFKYNADKITGHAFGCINNSTTYDKVEQVKFTNKRG